MNPWGTTAWGVADEAVPGAPPAYRLATDTGPLFLAADVEVFLPGATGTALGEAWGATAWGSITLLPAPIVDYSVLRFSDMGWTTRPGDPSGVQAYAPILLGGVTLDRALDLSPNGAGAGAAWGSLVVANDAAALTVMASTRNVDGRAIGVRIGRKQALSHGVWRDPSWWETVELLNGIGTSWRLEEAQLTIQMRDPSYWLERPVDGLAYAGTGFLEGTSALAGKRKPMLRGGTASAPVREIAPELVDPVRGIYQVSDGPGGIVTLYERGLAGGIAFAGAVGDIVAATPSAGTYVVESGPRGLLLRLGSFPPAGQITVDAWGSFVDGVTVNAGADVALQVLVQDIGVPSAWLDFGTFAGLAASAPWPTGFFVAAGGAIDGASLVGLLLRSAGGRLLPLRTGKLAAVRLGAIAAGTAPVASYGTAEILRCVPQGLGAPLMPPAYRIRVGHSRFNTTQTSALAPTLSGARIQELAEEWRLASSAAASVLSAWRRPSDPEIVQTALTDAVGGAALAAQLAALYCSPAGRSVYDVDLPLAYALRHDVGQPIQITYPGPLAAGALGTIIGEQLRTADGFATLQVLV